MVGVIFIKPKYDYKSLKAYVNQDLYELDSLNIINGIDFWLLNVGLF